MPAPLLDLPITYFTVAPLFVGPIIAGWPGLAGAVVGQVAGVLSWTVLHELANRRHMRGPRIVKVINREVGRVRNHAATWVTAIVTPVFWVIRVAELVVYPPLTWLVDLPAYRNADWVNVSRHKFKGLVGHDLIWCLYCDWMTGVWSLATEMLRNVESFWCPIRFDSSKKCATASLTSPTSRTAGCPSTARWKKLPKPSSGCMSVNARGLVRASREDDGEGEKSRDVGGGDGLEWFSK